MFYIYNRTGQVSSLLYTYACLNNTSEPYNRLHIGSNKRMDTDSVLLKLNIAFLLRTLCIRNIRN